jgi:hypothetical protein
MGPSACSEPVSENKVAQPPVSEGCEKVPPWDTCSATPAASHHRLATPAPGRRPGARRLLSGVHRDRQRRPQRPPCPRPAPPRRHSGRLELDHLGCSLRHLVDTITSLAERGIAFRNLQEATETTTPGGKLVFHIFAVLAEFERDLICERTAAGLAAARARGRRGGRPSVLTVARVRWLS